MKKIIREEQPLVDSLDDRLADEVPTDDPLDPDCPVEKLSLEDIDFEAGFWFRKALTTLCAIAWIVFALVLQVFAGVSKPTSLFLMLGGTTAVVVLSILVSYFWVQLFPNPSFFLRISILWARLFRISKGISASRLEAMAQRRVQLLDAQMARRKRG